MLIRTVTGLSIELIYRGRLTAWQIFAMSLQVISGDIIIGTSRYSEQVDAETVCSQARILLRFDTHCIAG